MADSMSTQSQGYNPAETNFVPFKIYLQLVPEQDGRRISGVRDKQKLVKAIQDELNEAGWNIHEPVSSGPGIKGIVTIVGFTQAVRLDEPIEQPLNKLNIITTGTVPGETTHIASGNAGVNGNLSFSRIPTDTVNTNVATLINSFWANSPTAAAIASFENLEYNGIMFGKGARSFPA